MTDVKANTPAPQAHNVQDLCEAAGLDLAAQRPWARVGLVDVADAAAVAPSQVFALFGTPQALAAAIWLRLDAAAVDAAAEGADQSLSVRGRAFEAAMTRFDLMEANRPAYASLLGFARRSFADRARRLGDLRRPARWLLEAGQVKPDGGASGLDAAVFAGVLHRAEAAWLNDEPGGQPRTLAKLDRDLADLEMFGAQLRRAGGRFRPRSAANDRA